MRKLAEVVFVITILTLSLLLTGCKKDRGDSDSSAHPGSHTHPDRLWSATTPAGITVVSDLGTLAQYESRWSSELFHWANITWEALDDEFKNAKQYYCYTIGWDCKNAEAYQLTVQIQAWDSRCVDAENPLQPKEIYEYLNGQWMCIDGWYAGSQRTIYLHLGDDPGQDHITIYSDDPPSSADFRAFQESAYSHELMHFFQQMAGLPYSDTPPQLPPRGSTVLNGYTIKLPGEEETEKGDTEE